MPRLIIPGDYQSQATRFLPYDPDGLEYWGMYDGDAQRCARNHAYGKPDAAVIGSPVYNAQDVQLSTSAATTPGYIQTQCVQTASQTFIVVVRIPGDETAVRPIIANGSSPAVAPPPVTSRGAGLNVNAGTTASDGLLTLTMDTSVNNAGTDVAANASLANGVATAAWVCVAGRYDAATKAYKAFNLSAGTSATNTSAYAADLASSPYRIGNSYTATSTYPMRLGMAAIYSVAKTDGELASIYAKLKAYYAKRGMSI